MFTRILVPLDGTPQSNVALIPARTIARLSNASVTLLHVIEPVDGDTSAAGLMQRQLERTGHEFGGDGGRLDVLVRTGSAADEILGLVAARAIDLVVMRTHGRAGLGRAVLGSVAQQVLARSEVPVLLVRPGARRLSHLGTILAPIDGSPGGAIALGTAIGLARSSSADVVLFEVVVPIPTYMYGDAAAGAGLYVDPAWDEEALSSARSYVDGLAARLKAAGLSVAAEVRFSPFVPTAIIDEADTRNVDLIVMSTHALSGPARALVGSVADEVMRNAHCPVLLLHRSNDLPHDSAQLDSKVATLAG